MLHWSADKQREQGVRQFKHAELLYSNELYLQSLKYFENAIAALALIYRPTVDDHYHIAISYRQIAWVAFSQNKKEKMITNLEASLQTFRKLMGLCQSGEKYDVDLLQLVMSYYGQAYKILFHLKYENATAAVREMFGDILPLLVQIFAEVSAKNGNVLIGEWGRDLERRFNNLQRRDLDFMPAPRGLTALDLPAPMGRLRASR